MTAHTTHTHTLHTHLCTFFWGAATFTCIVHVHTATGCNSCALSVQHCMCLQCSFCLQQQNTPHLAQCSLGFVMLEDKHELRGEACDGILGYSASLHLHPRTRWSLYTDTPELGGLPCTYTPELGGFPCLSLSVLRLSTSFPAHYSNAQSYAIVLTPTNHVVCSCYRYTPIVAYHDTTTQLRAHTFRAPCMDLVPSMQRTHVPSSLWLRLWYSVLEGILS